MNKTKIEWVKNPDGSQGYTWNPITGCLNGCPYCYARRLANTRLKERYLANKNWDTRPVEGDWPMYPNLDPFYPRFWEDRLIKPAKGHSGYIRTKRKGIFVCDMSDLFGIGIPEEWTKRVLAQCKVYHQHRFYLLTKQPQNLQKFSPFPDNCWVGVSITSSYDAILGNMALVEAPIKYISFEPLLEWYFKTGVFGKLSESFKKAGISWVIIGAQTKPYKPPKIEWVKEITEACDKAGVKVFLKDNLYKLLFERPVEDHDLYWQTMSELRQEMPCQI